MSTDMPRPITFAAGSEEVVYVVMVPEHAEAYQQWLRKNGLYLFRIPVETDDGQDYYSVGVGRARWEAYVNGDDRGESARSMDGAAG